MPLDRDFAEAFVTTMSQEGWSASLLAGELPNPLDISFTAANETMRLILYARRITLQSRSGPEPSTHNRPLGEMHTQMVFDDSKRGSGVTNILRRYCWDSIL